MRKAYFVVAMVLLLIGLAAAQESSRSRRDVF